MQEASVDDRQAPIGWLRSLSAVAVTGIALLAWLLIVLSTMFSWHVSTEWIYTGLALPAAGVGAAVAHLTRRPVYFWVGLAITLIPLVAYMLMVATTPPPPPGWND